MTRNKTNLIIDLRGALLLIERRTGRKLSVSGTSKKYGITPIIFQRYDLQAPVSVQLMYDMLIKNPKLPIDKIEIETSKKIVQFIKEFLKDNPEINFFELVREKY